MLLAIDVGNPTPTHLGMFRATSCWSIGGSATGRSPTADELATVIASLLGLRGLSIGDVDAAIVSSVVPTLAHEYEQLTDRYLERQRGAGGTRTEDGDADPHRHAPGARARPARQPPWQRTTGLAGRASPSISGTAINYDVVSSAGSTWAG